jgi:hypothetical protein
MTGTTGGQAESVRIPERAGRWAVAAALSLGAALALVPIGAFHDRNALLVAGAGCFVLAQVCSAGRRLIEVRLRTAPAEVTTFTGASGLVAACTLLGAALGALLGFASGSGETDVVDADALNGAGVGAAVLGGSVIVALVGTAFFRWVLTPDVPADEEAPRAAWIVLPQRVSNRAAAAIVAAGGSTALSIASLIAGNEDLRWYAGAMLAAALAFAWAAKRAADRDGSPVRVES